MNLAQALVQAKLLGLDRLDAQLLLLYTLGRPNQRAWLLAHDTDVLPDTQAQTYFAYCKRRQSDVPLAYIVGEKEFYGLSLAISPAVLVPRPDTEILVDWALECGDRLQSTKPNGVALRVMDLGTGSGAIALAIKAARPQWQVSGLDASSQALDVARHNGQHLGLAVTWLRGNWMAELSLKTQRTPYDLIVSNPPYIAPDDRHLLALQAEPIAALVAEQGGLADLCTIILQAPLHLASSGQLLLEHGHEQANAVKALLMRAGWKNVSSRPDFSGVLRCTGGERPMMEVETSQLGLATF